MTHFVTCPSCDPQRVDGDALGGDVAYLLENKNGVVWMGSLHPCRCMSCGSELVFVDKPRKKGTGNRRVPW